MSFHVFFSFYQSILCFADLAKSKSEVISDLSVFGIEVNLREISERYTSNIIYRSIELIEFSGEYLHECGLSDAISPDNRDPIGCIDDTRNIREDFLPSDFVFVDVYYDVIHSKVFLNRYGYCKLYKENFLKNDEIHMKTAYRSEAY